MGQTPRGLSFPFKGLNKTAGYHAQPDLTSTDVFNVRPFDPLEGRLRGGRREGLSKWLNVQVNGSASIQRMTKAVRSASYGDTFREQVLVATERASNLSAHILDNDGVALFTYDTGNNTSATSRDGDGDYYIGGTRSSTWTGSGGANASAWKLDGVGGVLWAFDTGNTINELVYSETGDRVLLVGVRSTTWTGSGGANAAVWCLNADTGAVLWTYDTGADVRHCAVDSSGNFYLAGIRTSGNTIWKLSNAGVLLADFDTGAGATQADCIAVNADGSVAVSQRLATTDWEGTDASSKNVWVLSSTLASVTASFEKQTTAESAGVALNVEWAADGDLIVSGPRTSSITTTKFDLAGMDDWTYDAGANSDALAVDSAGSIFIGMERNTAWTGSGGANASVLKLSTAGAVIWDYDTGDRAAEIFVYRDPGPAAVTRETSLVVVAGGTIRKVVNGTVSTPAGGDDALTVEYGRIQLQNAYNKVFLVDGESSLVYDLATNTVDDWAGEVTAGTLQVGSRLVALYRGRLVISGVVADPNNWFMSRVGDPFDFDYSPATIDQKEAVAGNLSQAGLLGDVVTALIPFGDDKMIFGCDSSIWQLTGDPVVGGTYDNISEQTGIAFGKAWAKDPANTLYFMGVDGIYRILPGGLPESMTNGRLDEVFREVDLSLNLVRLEWDFILKRLWVVIAPLDNTSQTDVYVWDQRTDSWWFDQHDATSRGPADLYGYDAEAAQDKALLFGSRDGFIRQIDQDAPNDDGHPINNRVRFTPILSDDPSQHIRLSGLSGLLGEDSSPVHMKVLAGQTAEQLAKNATAKVRRILRAGRNAQSVAKVSGANLAIELSQTDGVPGPFSWALERISGKVERTGMTRRHRIE